MDKLNFLSPSSKEFTGSSSGSESEILSSENNTSTEFSTTKLSQTEDLNNSVKSLSHREIVSKEGTTKVIKTEVRETEVDRETLQNCQDLFGKLNTSEITIKQSVQIKSSQSYQKLIKINQNGEIFEGPTVFDNADNDSNEDYHKPPPLPPKPAKTKEFTDEREFRPRVPSDYENKQQKVEPLAVTPGKPSKPPVLPRKLVGSNMNTLKAESHLIHHSSSAHSVSEQILVNGEVHGSSADCYQ